MSTQKTTKTTDTKQKLINEYYRLLDKVRNETGNPKTKITREYFLENSRHSNSDVTEAFGGWMSLKRTAEKSQRESLGVESETLLIGDYQRLLKKLAKESNGKSQKMTQGYYQEHGKYSKDTYTGVFGSWMNFKRAAEPQSEINIGEDPEGILIEDYQRLVKALGRESPGPDGKTRKLTREYYRSNGKYPPEAYVEVFGSWMEFKRAARAATEVNRDSLHIRKTHRRKSTGKRYFVTAAVAGAGLNHEFFESVQGYCEQNNAELVILPMRGVLSRQEGYSDELVNLVDHMATDFTFNSNLRALDFIIAPQQINPLTGLGRFGQKQSSIIVSSPKQQMITVPTANVKLPHILHSTGVITRPPYRSTRQGALAQQDNIYGGLVVEIQDDKVFHLRQVQADKTGMFYDLDYAYSGRECEKANAKAVVLGDVHTGHEDVKAIQASREQIKLLKPEYVFLHDFFDGTSISHHHMKDMKAQVRRPPHIDTLEKELDLNVQSLTEWATMFPEVTFVIVRSNHDEHLDRYLAEGRYVHDRFNHLLSLRLAEYYIRGLNPIEEYVKSKADLTNVKWLRREDDFKIAGTQLAAHGDMGPNGSRGSAQNMEKAYGNSMTGHSHTPGILRGAKIVGCNCVLDRDFTKGQPSSWLHTNGTLYANGMFQLLNSFEGDWRI